MSLRDFSPRLWEGSFCLLKEWATFVCLCLGFRNPLLIFVILGTPRLTKMHVFITYSVWPKSTFGYAIVPN